MQASDTRVLGRSGLPVTVMGFGGAPLGNMYQAFSDADARATVQACYDAGIRYFDTAPLYGYGLSEHRLGEALRGRARDSFVLSTKVGRLLRPGDPATLEHGQFKDALPFAEVYDYSYEGVLRSVEDSLQRLGMHRIDILLVHDLDVWTHGSEAARRERVAEFMAGGYRAMVGLREAGAVRAIGAGVNETAACQDLALRGDFDCFLLAGRYTLLEQGAARRLPAAVRAARHRADHRRRLQHRHPRDRRGRRRLLPVRAGPARDHGAGAPDRGGLRPPRRAPADRGAAVPARPPGRRDRDSRDPLAGRGRAEPRDLRARRAGRPLGRAQAGRPAAPGRADPLTARHDRAEARASLQGPVF